MLSKYEILKEIGSGTFGKVHLVTSRASRNMYVLKEVCLTSMSAKEKQQALTEVSVLSKCKHTNIIRYKEASIEPEKGVLSMIMEYAECGDLYTVIKKRRGAFFKEEDILSWFVQITFALQYIHENNILHRDLKTRNIFLTRENIIKVGDFGIARVLKESQELANTAIGTPYYLSPEICLRKPYNCKSDIWALGCVLFEMSALVHPFQAKNFQQLVLAILNVKYAQLPKHCSPLIRDLVKTLLNNDPVKRPSSEEILALPMLQPHVVRCKRNCGARLASISSSDSDRLLTLKKGAGPRRFSSNDVLDTAKVPFAAKRRASVSTPDKSGAKMEKNRKEKLVTGVDFSQDVLLGDPVLHSTCVPSKTYSMLRLNGLETELENMTGTLIPKVDSMCDTYTLSKRRHALDNSPPQSAVLWERENSASSCINELPRLQPLSARVFSALSSSKDRERSTLQNSISKMKNSDSSKAIPKQDVKCGRACNEASYLCSHAPLCHRCKVDILWKNRIRRSGLVDEREKVKLANYLRSVFGNELFTTVCNELSEGWENSVNGSNFLNTTAETLTPEQMQCLPLLLQFIQLSITH